jgi:hypothetical protein
MSQESRDFVEKLRDILKISRIVTKLHSPIFSLSLSLRAGCRVARKPMWDYVPHITKTEKKNFLGNS